MYGKIFVQMYEGTLATKGPWEALIAFQQFIVLADRNGHVDMTAEAISRRTTVPLRIIRKGIKALEKPDPDSRTPDEGGRRIIRLSKTRPWGWRIVNYEKYRTIRSQEERREYHRKYWNDNRSPARDATNRDTQHDSTNSTNSSKQRQKQKHRQESTPSIGKSNEHDEFVAALDGPSSFEEGAGRTLSGSTPTHACRRAPQ